MKKIMLIAAIACMALVSCTKEELEPNDESGAIGFTTYASRQVNTKAVMTSTELQSTGFGVLAFYTAGDNFGEGTHATPAPDFMYNQLVKWTDTDNDEIKDAWTYSPLKYWPNKAGDKITFFGYAPYNSDPTSGIIKLSNNVNSGYPFITFNDATSNTDLVAAYNPNLSKSNEDGQKVSMSFKHILTRLAIYAKIDHDIEAEGPATKVFITDVKVNEGSVFYTSGTFTFNGSDTLGVWSGLSAVNNAPLALSINKTAASWGAKKPGTAYTEQSIELTQDGEPTSLLTNQYNFIVPRAYDPSKSIEFSVSYDIVTEDAKLATGYSKTSNKVDFTLKANSLHKMKAAYGVILTVSLKGIQIEGTVEDWDRETTQTI